jgi:ABC-type transporter Mla subunit MlaD
VKDGTSKIDTVAAAVTQLSEEVSPGVDQFGNPAGTLFDGIQTLLAESGARDMTIHALQASVNALFAAINQRLPDGGANGPTLSTSVVGPSFLVLLTGCLYCDSDGSGGEFVR